MLGSITKRRFFRDAWLDATGLQLLARTGGALGRQRSSAPSPRCLEERGLPVTDPTPFLADRLAREGVLGKHEPSDEELADARYGLELARGIGRLDLGQTVVVKDRVALAVEALEGTDACIRRGGELAKAGGFVVVKAVKPQQDRRFDLPAVGPDTVDSIIAARGLPGAGRRGRGHAGDGPRRDGRAAPTTGRRSRCVGVTLMPWLRDEAGGAVPGGAGAAARLADAGGRRARRPAQDAAGGAAGGRRGQPGAGRVPGRRRWGSARPTWCMSGERPGGGRPSGSGGRGPRPPGRGWPPGAML